MICTYPYVLFDLKVGLEVIFFALFSLVAIIIYLISITIVSVRMKKCQETEDKPRFKWTYVYCIPIVLILISFVFNLLAVKNANIIIQMEANGFETDPQNVAASTKCCEEISLGKKYYNNWIEVGYDEYYVSNSYKLTVTSNTDENFIGADMSTIKSIYDFQDYEKRYSMPLDENDKISLIVRRVEKTDYYIVTYLVSSSGNAEDGGFVYGEALFLKDVFVGNIKIRNIDSILLNPNKY
jgi:hypothetical protein